MNRKDLELECQGLASKIRAEEANYLDILDLIENYITYCPTCGSCGESGCCSPSNCKAVQCVYGEYNLKEYKDLLEENDRMRAQLNKLVRVETV